MSKTSIDLLDFWESQMKLSHTSSNYFFRKSPSHYHMMLIVMHAYKYNLGLSVEELKTKLFKTSRPKSALMITADDEMKMQITIDIMLTKLIKRSVPVKSLVYGKTEPSGRVQKKEITVQQGLSKEQCKKINQFIKSSKIKVQPQTQSDSVRVSSKKKDDLQAVMQAIKKHEFDFDVQFANFR